MSKFPSVAEATQAAEVKKSYGNFIGGKFVPSVKGQTFTNPTPITGKPLCEVQRSTAEDIEKALDAAHPGLADRLFDDAGGLRRFVNVFLADEDVRFLEGLATPVTEGQTLSIVPAVAGG